MTLIERTVLRDPLLSFEQLRLRFVQMVTTVGLIFLVVDGANNYFSGESVQLSVPIFITLFAGLLFFTTRGIGTFLLSDILIITITFATLVQTQVPLVVGVSALACVASAMFGGRLLYIGVIATITVRAITLEAILFTTDPSYDFFLNTLPYTTALIGFSLILRVFRARFQEFILNARRTSDLLSASAIIGQVIGQYLDLTPLLNRSVEIVRDRLGFYHVQIFLADESNDYARLTASTGDVGRVLLAQNQRVSVNANTLIGRALQAGEALVARETATREDFTFRDSLPNTRSELVVPIVDGDKIIGALDIHSMRSNAFNRNDVQALEVMANQLATAIRNARLFERQESTIRENKRLFLESETNLREIERLNRQLTKQAWDEYLQGRGVVSGVTWTQREFKPGAEWTPTMIQAAQRRRVMTINDTKRGRRTIAVPVELRGEVVGAIEIETTDSSYASDTADMLQAISQRLAVSLDNARLFEETQEATAQEQRIGEIVSGYQSADSIDELLQITLQGLTEALGAEKGMIRLGNFVNPNKSASTANGHEGDTT